MISALKPAVNGRHGHEPLLMRPWWVHVDGSFAWQQCLNLVPWRSVNDLRRPWAAIVARAGLPATVTPYSLRHSSIARSLKAGLPGQLVARLHDTSAVQIERAYSREIVSLMDELAQRAVISLSPASVTPIAAVR